jgi:hypothetical protein
VDAALPEENGDCMLACPISASLVGDTLRKACFSKIGLVVTSFVDNGPLVCKFAPRCGIKEDGVDDNGRGVLGSCEAESPSVCFFTVGRLPEFCFEMGQFAPEIEVLADCEFGVDTVGPTSDALPRCCFAIDPPPDG